MRILFRVALSNHLARAGMRGSPGLVRCGLNTGVGTCEVPELAACSGLPVHAGQFRDPASPGPSDLNPISECAPKLIIIIHF